MKRFLAAILCICAAAAPFFPEGGAFPRAVEATVRADETATADGTGADGLILPSSYEQYLPLSSPSDIAVTDGYMAISDGNVIYLYDRAADSYSRYEHTANEDSATNTIEELQFAEDGNLYFRDVSLFLYRMDYSQPALESENTGLACNAFEIYADTIYYVTTSQLRKTTLDELDPAKGETVVFNILSGTALALDNEFLYYTEGGKSLRRTSINQTNPDDSSFSEALLQNETVVSLVVYQRTKFYYTDTAGRLLVYNSNNGKRQIIDEGHCTSLFVRDKYIYVADGNRIRQYEPRFTSSSTDEETECGAFTDYEIGASSSSENRLSGASSLCLAGELLLTADAGNSRVSVYDASAGTVRTVSVPAGADLLASDGETMAAAGGTSVSLYDLASPETPSYTFSDFQSAVVGAACVYGVYYFVTSNNYFYRISPSEEGWTAESSPKPALSYTARLLAADAYGDLYVAFSDGSVCRYTESEFTDAAAAGEKVCNVPVLAEQIAVDYARTVYALSDNRLYICAGEQASQSYPLGKSLVWSQTEDTPAVSFAFGVESEAVYLLYEGDFIIRTFDIPLPTVRTIAVDGADERIFDGASADFSVVQTAENSLFVSFELESLDGAEYFPYLGYERRTESVTALKLEETELYDILAVFDEENRQYTAALVLKSHCEELPEEEYLKEAEGFEDGKGYLTNAVSLYKYPYLTELLTAGSLPKNAEVTVLGQIDTPDYRYYRIAWTDGEGNERTGFVPVAYVTAFDGSPVPAEQANFGGTGADTDSVWRLAFLLLGCASVCVLVDFLIIKRKEK